MDSTYPGMVNLSGTLCYMNSILQVSERACLSCATKAADLIKVMTSQTQAFASLSYLKTYLEQIIFLAEEVDLNTPVIDALEGTIQGESS